MNNRKNRSILLLLLIGALLLAACGAPLERGTVLSVAVVTPSPGATGQGPTGTATEPAAAEAPATETPLPTREVTATATPEATATTTVTSAATAAPSRPQSLVRRIRFPAGATSDAVNGQVGAGQRDVYLFRALGGQAASLSLWSPADAANFTLSGLDDGQFHKQASDTARNWQGTLPLTQDYIVVVTAPSTTEYSLALTINPLPTTASIRGLVWQDSNRDNHPGDDKPLAGVLVQLHSGAECSQLMAETTTAVGGAYAFYDLPAGTYCVRSIVDGTTVGTLVHLGAGEEAVDVNLMWPGPADAGSSRE